MTVLPLSALGDRLGHRTLYQCGQTVFVLAPALCFIVHALPLLVLIRGVQALGAAAIFSVNSAIIRAIYPQAHLGRGLAFNTVVAATAASVAPTLGGLILSFAPWPWLFAICSPLALLSILVGRKTLPDPLRRREPYDLLAALMCAATIGAAVAGLELALHGGPVSLSATVLVVAVLVGAVFVRREASQARPVLPVDLLRRKPMVFASLGSLAANIATMSVMLTLPFRLQRGFGYSPAEAGLVIGAWPMVMMVVAPAAGMLSDRIAAGWLGGVGMTIAVVGMIALAFPPASPSHLDLIWRIMVAAMGFGLFFSPNARQIIGAAPIERVAAAGALAQTTRLAGQVLGSTLAGALLAGGVGAGRVPALAAAALALITGLCSLALLGSSRLRPAAV
jgi:DHA2 family multidrug resistance protein-like MFS transporter